LSTAQKQSWAPHGVRDADDASWTGDTVRAPRYGLAVTDEAQARTAALSCLVLNAGGSYVPDKTAAEGWADALASDPASSPDLAFIQEVPSQQWLQVWRIHGFRVLLGHTRGWKVRSAILTRLPDEQLAPLTSAHLPELAYHGEYVAAGRLVGWGPSGSDLHVFSVHASPHPTISEYLAHHPQADRLKPRRGGDDPRYGGRLFDADVVLDTIGQHPPVLACGDLNEARGWDQLPDKAGQTWGQEYFGAPNSDNHLVGGRVHTYGLTEIPLSASGEEVVSRVRQGHPELQLDHILISTAAARQVRDVHVDPAWAASPGTVAGLADHAPIWFTLHRAG